MGHDGGCSDTVTHANELHTCWSQEYFLPPPIWLMASRRAVSFSFSVASVRQPVRRRWRAARSSLAVSYSSLSAGPIAAISFLLGILVFLDGNC